MFEHYRDSRHYRDRKFVSDSQNKNALVTCANADKISVAVLFAQTGVSEKCKVNTI